MSQNRVLVVEDQFLVSLDLQCMLSDAGFEVVGPVMTLEEAMLAAEQADLRCAVVDANLNGRSAGPVAEKLKERGVPFLVVSGYEKPCLPLAFSEAPRIAKPIQANSLITMLRQLCFEPGCATIPAISKKLP